MKEWKIYKHTNLTNGKIYIGQTCEKNINNRFGSEGHRYEKSAPIFWKGIKKYGWEGFSHEIIEDKIYSETLANERERYWIKYYDCCVLDGKDKGYNADRGGKGFSSEFASIISKQNWENEEYRKIFCKPVICVNTQKIYPSIIEAAKDTNTSKDGISRACSGINHSAGQDENGNLLQWAYYEEGKEYIYSDPFLLDKKNTRVICLTTGEIFNTTTEAANKYNIARSCISSCLSGKQKTAGQLPNGTRLCWDKYEEGKTYSFKTNSGKNNKQIQCIETQQIFNSIKEGAESIGKAASNLSAHLHGKQLSCGKDSEGNPLHWQFITIEEDEYEEM